MLQTFPSVTMFYVYFVLSIILIYFLSQALEVIRQLKESDAIKIQRAQMRLRVRIPGVWIVFIIIFFFLSIPPLCLLFLYHLLPPSHLFLLPFHPHFFLHPVSFWGFRIHQLQLCNLYVGLSSESEGEQHSKEFLRDIYIYSSRSKGGNTTISIIPFYHRFFYLLRLFFLSLSKNWETVIFLFKLRKRNTLIFLLKIKKFPNQKNNQLCTSDSKYIQGSS